MTSGIPDYVPQPQFVTDLVSDPFAAWTPEQLLAEIADLPLHFPPGTNWNYSHSNYVILGLVLEKVTGKPVDELMTQKVLGPLGLDNTVDNATAVIPEPALHSFSSERRELFGVPADQPFYEESTFWNPSWTITRGAVQTTNIHDMAASMAAIGEGTLLSPASHAAQVSTGLRGFGTTQEGCSCFPQQEGYAYGIGVVTTGNWLLQNPLFSGEAGASAYLASQKIAIGVAVTYRPEAFDAQGNYSNQADVLFRKIGALMAPDDAPPVKN
jgi:CubicO group peptidase (beta-lactamase class C family)